MGNNRIFVSYRRTDLLGNTSGTDVARTIKQHLEISGYKNQVFFDYSEISDDEFGNVILSEIRKCKVFILVLTHDTMQRCVNEDDWVRREILEAVKHNKKIIPIEVDDLFNGYPIDMISELDIIKRLQHSKVHMDSSFENDMNVIIEKRIIPIIKPNKTFNYKALLITLISLIALGIGWYFVSSYLEDNEYKIITHKPTIDELMEIDDYLKSVEYPQDLGNGIEIIESYRSGDTIVYEYNINNIDVSNVSDDEFEAFVRHVTTIIEQMKPMFIQQWVDMYNIGLTDNMFKDAVQIIECGMSMAYHYRDANGIRLYTLKVNNSEIIEEIESQKKRLN